MYEKFQGLIISRISFQAKANSSSVAMEDKRKAPERGTSYEENAVDKKILEKIPVRRKKIMKNNYHNKISLIPSSLMRKPILQTYDHLVLKSKREENMANRRNNNPCYRGKSIEIFLKQSGRIKVLKYVYRETCVQCSEEHVQNNTR